MAGLNDLKKKLDVNGDEKVDLKDAKAAAEKLGVDDVQDVKNLAEKAGIGDVDGLMKKAGGLFGKKN